MFNYLDLYYYVPFSGVYSMNVDNSNPFRTVPTIMDTSEDSTSESRDTEIVIWDCDAVEIVTEQVKVLSLREMPKSVTQSFASQSLGSIPQMTPRRSEEYMRRRVSETADSPRLVVDMKIAALPEGMDAKKILAVQEKLFEELIKKVPQHTVSLKRCVGKMPACTLYNNYGITPDFGTVIETKDGNIAFWINKERKEFPATSCYTDGNQVFITEKQAILADTVSVSKSRRGYHCFAVADGCNWGERPKQAATLASMFSMMVLEQKFDKESKLTTREIAQIQLDALIQVQNELGLKGEMVSETTMTIACIADTHLILASVGDSKVFVLRKTSNAKLKCVDITEGSRRASRDASDPGGRLGGKSADWRNLALAVVKLEPNDIIIGCSDGLHDNFDPVHLGLTPKDLGYHETSWDSTKRHLVQLRQQVLTKNIVSAIEADEGKNSIGDALTKHVAGLTLKGKLFMMENPRASRPVDYKAYPGKDDHVSVVVFTYEPEKLRGSFFSRK